MSRKDMKKVKGNPPTVPFRFSTPEGYKAFCEEYAERATPKLEAVDRFQADSMERARWKVIR